MNIAQAARRQIWRVNLTSWLPPAGQLVTLVVVATALLMPAPFTQNELPAGWARSDLMISHWPTALLIQRTFAQLHQLPLWNPYFGGGQPLGADPLAAMFYPPTQLVQIFSLRNYYLVLIMGHLIFAGLGMLLLASRAFKLPSLPALVAAVSYMATPRLISHLGAGHVTILQTVAWFPWLALACWATVQDPRRWGALLAIAFAMTLLAGHPQMAYYGLLMTGVLAVWLLVRRWQAEGRRALLVSMACLAAAAVIGILLAAVHLLPLFEFTANSTRQLSVRSTDTYPLVDFLHALISPRERTGPHPWENTISPGPVVLALAALAAVVRGRKAWPLVLGIVIVAGLAMGNASQLYLVVSRILPDFDRFRGLARIWFVALVPMSLLAGLGAEILLGAVRRVSSPGAVAAGFLTVLVVAVSLVVMDIGYAQVGDVTAITTPSLMVRMATQLAGSGRIYGVQENIPQVNAVELQVRLADGWDPLLIESYVAYMERAGGYTASGYLLHIPPFDSPRIKPDTTLLGLMNVSVVVSRRPLSDPHLVLAGQADGTLIYENMADAGPAYLVGPGPSGNLPSLAELQRLDGGVHVVTLTPEQETFTFSSSTAAYFVIATPAFPGWTAELDGHSVQIQKIAGVLPAIKVGPGAHTLSYTYSPTSVHLGAMLSLIGLLAVLAWFIVGRRFKRGKPGDPAPAGSGEGKKPELESPDEIASPIELQ